MIALLTPLVSKLGGILMGLVNLKPVLLSEYVMEQTMMANLNIHWFKIMIPVSITLLLIGIILNTIGASKRGYTGEPWMGGATASYILCVVAVVILACTYNANVTHMINATTPTLQMTREILSLL